MTGLRSALWLPLFDDLADPRMVAGPAAGAKEAGRDGCFVWDKLSCRPPVREVADPWITRTARPRPWIGSAAVGSSSVPVRAVLRDGRASPSGE